MNTPKFVRSERGLVNVSYIRRVYIEPPQYNLTQYIVVAEVDGIGGGNDILFRADTEKECQKYVDDFLKEESL